MAVMSPTDMLNEVQKFLEASVEELAQMLGVHRRSVERWLEGSADPHGGNRRELQRLVELRDLLQKTYGSAVDARKWLHSPNRAFGGISPYQILVTRGPAEVAAYLQRPGEARYV